MGIAMDLGMGEAMKRPSLVRTTAGLVLAGVKPA